MNKNSLFTKAIAGLLAVLMVFGTLVSLRGLSVVNAEAKAELAQTRGDNDSDNNGTTQPDHRVYSTQHFLGEVHLQQKTVKVGYWGGWGGYTWYPPEYASELSTAAIYTDTYVGHIFNRAEDEDASESQVVFYAQDQYWNPGAKLQTSGGVYAAYTDLLGREDWTVDESEPRSFYNNSGYEAMGNYGANKHWWLDTGTYFEPTEDGQNLWDLIEKIIYLYQQEDSTGHMHNWFRANVYNLMRTEAHNSTNLGTLTGGGIQVGQDVQYDGNNKVVNVIGMDLEKAWADGNIEYAKLTSIHDEYVNEAPEGHPEDEEYVSGSKPLPNSRDEALLDQMMIALYQIAIYDLVAGRYYPDNTTSPSNYHHSYKMIGNQLEPGTDNLVARREGTRDNLGEGRGRGSYIRMMVNELLRHASQDEINIGNFEIKYSMPDNSRILEDDSTNRYRYKGVFVPGAPVGEPSVGKASVDKDAYLTANGTYNIELYVKSDSSATTVDGKAMDGTTVIKDELSDKFEFINGTPEFEYKLIDPNGNVIDLPNGVTITPTVNGSKVEFTGFPFNEYPNYELVITIKNIVAKDNTDGFGNENISTNANTGTVPGVYSQGGNTPGKDGMDNELKFPERKVSIRYRYVIYDFGLEMKDDVHFNEFFNDENMHAHHATETPIEKILTVDYMFGKVNTNPYSNVYPYAGARIMNDETGKEEKYAEGGYHHFTFGFNETAEGTRGYFQPNEISHRDWNASALLQLEQHDSSAWEGSYTRNRYASPKYEWCTIRFIPATNVLYEADQNYNATTNTSDFAEFHNGGISGGTAWSCEGTPKPDAHQEHYNDRYGYDANYNGQLNKDSNGSAMKVVVTEDLYVDVRDKGAKWPSMNFDFTGSGFSFSTRCGIDTGIFVIDVVPKGENQFYNSGDANTYKHTLINTRYYGGSGYEANDNVIVKSSLLHQVPVIRITDLAYGNYTVYITPVYLPAWADVPNPDGTDANVGTKGAETVDLNKLPGFEKAGYTVTELFPEPEQTKGGYIHLSSFTCYIDTIRVYHPRGQEYIEEAIDDQEAYYATNELNNRYVEVRKLLISAIDSLMNNTSHDGMLGGAMFIDYGPQITVNGKPQYINGDDFDPKNPDTFTIDHYKFYGPNNELYLNQNGSYSFSLSNPKDVTNLHLSMKVTGAATDGKVEILLLTEDRTGGLGNIDEGKNVIKSYVVEVKSATEMYYDIALVSEGTDLSNLKAVAIRNTSDADAIISIMNIKIVHKNGVTAPKSVTDPDIVTTLETAEFANVIGFGIKGDVNGDRSVNMMDAIMLIRGALGGESLGISATFCADVDGNGTIDMVDALNTMRLALEN